MDELVRWLGEQLDADAREIAEPYAEKAWHTRDCAIHPDVWGNEGSSCDCPVPARVLREIDADRALLAQYAEVAANDVDDVEYAHGWANALGLAVRLRASAFSDRPGYRDDWRP